MNLGKETDKTAKSRINKNIQNQPWLRRLYLPAYSITEAAKYAGTSPQTVSNWHYYSGLVGPAIAGKERGKALSYFQLIEVAFVATMRKEGLSLQKIRKAREYALQIFEAEYPFAQLRWKTEGTHLTLELKDIEGDAEISQFIARDSVRADLMETSDGRTL